MVRFKVGDIVQAKRSHGRCRQGLLYKIVDIDYHTDSDLDWIRAVEYRSSSRETKPTIGWEAIRFKLWHRDPIRSLPEWF